MIIVSQDKYNILNFDTTVNIGVEEITTLSDIVQISAQTSGNTIVLGEYKTEERAKEVLKEIIKCYMDTNYEYENCWCLRNLVYKMPEK